MKDGKGGIKELVKDFYATYAPEKYSEEQVSKIQSIYGDDYETLIKDFYAKYAPEKYSDERVPTIASKYGLKKKDVSQVQQEDVGEPLQEQSDFQQGTTQLASKEDPKFGDEILDGVTPNGDIVGVEKVPKLTDIEQTISNTMSVVNPMISTVSDDVVKIASDNAKIDNAYKITSDLLTKIDNLDVGTPINKIRLLEAKAARWKIGLRDMEDEVKKIQKQYGSNIEYTDGSIKDGYLYRAVIDMLTNTAEVQDAIKEKKTWASGVPSGISNYIKGMGDILKNLSSEGSKEAKAIKALQDKIDRYNSNKSASNLTDREIRYIDLAQDADFVNTLNDKVNSGKGSFSDDENFFLYANDEGIANQIDLKNRVARDDITFSDAEIMYMQAGQAYIDTMMLLKNKVPVSYEVGQSIGSSIGFMGEMALTAGFAGVGKKLTLSALKKIGTKRLATKIGVSVSKQKVIANMLGKVGAASIRTVGMPMFYQGTVKDIVEEDKSFGDAVTSNYAKVFKTVLIESMFSGTGGANKIDKFFSGAGVGIAGAKNPVQFIKGLAGEGVEEFLDQTLDYKLSGDDWNTALDKVTDDRSMEITAWSIMGLMAGIGSVQTVFGNKVSNYRKLLSIRQNSDINTEQIKALMTIANNSMAKSRLNLWGKRVDADIKSQVDAAMDGDGVIGTDVISTVRDAIYRTANADRNQGALTEDEIKDKVVSGLNYARWKFRDKVYDESKRTYEEQNKQIESGEEIKADDSAVKDKVEETAPQEPTTQIKGVSPKEEAKADNGEKKVVNEVQEKEEIVKSLETSKKKYPKAKDKLTQKLADRKTKELQDKYQEDIYNELEIATKRLMKEGKDGTTNFDYNNSRYKIKKKKDGSISVYELKEGNFVEVLNNELSDAEQNLKNAIIKEGLSQQDKLVDAVYEQREVEKGNIIDKYNNKIKDEVESFIAERESVPLSAKEKQAGLNKNDLSIVGDSFVDTGSVDESVNDFKNSDKGKELAKKGKIDAAVKLIEDYLNDFSKNEKKKTKEKLPSQKPRRMRLVEEMATMKRERGIFGKGYKKGSKETMAFKKAVLENVNQAYKALQYNDKIEGRDNVIPTAKSRQINNIIRDITEKNEVKSMQKIDNILDEIEFSKEINQADSNIKRLRKKVRGSKKGNLGSLYNKVTGIIGLSKGMRFSAENLRRELTPETYQKVQDLTTQINEGKTLSDALRVLKASDVNKLHKEVIDEMREVKKRKEGDSRYRAELLADILSDVTVDKKVTPEGIENTHEALAEKMGEDADAVKDAYKKAREMEIEKYIGDKISGRKEKLGDSPEEIEQSLTDIIKEQFFEEGETPSEQKQIDAKVRSILSKSTPLNNLKSYGVTLGHDFDLDAQMDMEKGVIDEALDIVKGDKFIEETKENIPNIQIVVDELFDVLGEGGDLNSDTVKKNLENIGALTDFRLVIDALKAISNGNIDVKYSRAMQSVRAYKTMAESLNDGGNALGLSKVRFKEQSQKKRKREYSGFMNIAAKPVDWIGDMFTSIMDVTSDRAVKSYKKKRKITPSPSHRLNRAGRLWMKRNPIFMIGEIMNPYSVKGTEEFMMNVYKPLDSRINKYNLEFNAIEEGIRKKFKRALSGITNEVTGLSSNKEFNLNVLATVYGLQLEIDSNPDLYGKFKVKDFINATRMAAMAEGSTFDFHDISDLDVIEAILNEYSNKDGVVDMNRVREVSNGAVGELVDYINKISNNTLLPYVSHSAFTQTGNAFVPINNRMHRKAYSSKKPSTGDKVSELKDKIMGMNRVDGIPSPNSQHERVAEVPAISWLGVDSFMSDVNDVLYDYHVSGAMREVSSTFDAIKNKIDSEYFTPNLSKKEIEAKLEAEAKAMKEGKSISGFAASIPDIEDKIRDIKEKMKSDKTPALIDKLDDLEYAYDMSIRLGIMRDVLDKTIENEYLLSLVRQTGTEKIIYKLIDQTANTALVKPSRVVAEFSSNVGAAAIMTLSRQGVKHISSAMSTSLSDVRKNTGSSVEERMGRFNDMDLGIRGKHSMNRARSSNLTAGEKFSDLVDRNWVGTAKKASATWALRTPDKTVGTYMWNNSFLSRFKRLTGASFDNNKYKNDKAYRNKYKNQIQKASGYADGYLNKIMGASSRASGFSEIAYSRLGKFDKNGHMTGSHFAFIAKMQNQFRGFVAQDAYTAMQSARRLLDRRYSQNDQGGSIRRDAARALTAVYIRQLVYMKAISSLGIMAKGAWSAAMLASDDDKDFLDTFLSKEAWSDASVRLQNEWTSPEMKKDAIFGVPMMAVGFFKNAFKMPVNILTNEFEDFFKTSAGNPTTISGDDIFASPSMDALYGTLQMVEQIYKNGSAAIKQIGENSRSGVDIGAEGAFLNLAASGYQALDLIFGVPLASAFNKIDEDDLTIEERSKNLSKLYADTKAPIRKGLDVYLGVLGDMGYSIPTKLDNKEVQEFIDSQIPKGDVSAPKQIKRKKEAVLKINAGFNAINTFVEDYANRYIANKVDEDRHSWMITPDEKKDLVSKIKAGGNRVSEIKKLGRSYAVDTDYNDSEGVMMDMSDDTYLWIANIEELNDYRLDTESITKTLDSDVLDKFERIDEELGGKLSKREIGGVKLNMIQAMSESFLTLAGDNLPREVDIKLFDNLTLPTSLTNAGVSVTAPTVGYINPALSRDIIDQMRIYQKMISDEMYK